MPARLVEQRGGLTWEVPAFRAGHAEATAGAAELGNAILLGHVTSRQAGNVFKDLDKARAGDQVLVLSGSSASTTGWSRCVRSTGRTCRSWRRPRPPTFR
ncbi:MAG: sortase [Pyrinomonadaceae bacterium]|nr:sortase [Pyrinomonadaceae bacterium]